MKSTLSKIIIILLCALFVLLAVIVAKIVGNKSANPDSSEPEISVPVSEIENDDSQGAEISVPASEEASEPISEASSGEDVSAGVPSEEPSSAESHAEPSSEPVSEEISEETSEEISEEISEEKSVEESSEEPSAEESKEASKEVSEEESKEESKEESQGSGSSTSRNYEQPQYITREEGKKYVAITFDDGPSSNTPILLDFLEEKGYVVTFFSVGHRLESSKVGAYITRAVSLGCEAGVHGYTHDYSYKTCKDDVYKREVYDTAALVEKYAGYFPIVMRPPYGEITKERAKASEFNIIIWDVDSEDWRHTGRSSAEQIEKNIQTIVDNVVNSKYLRNGSIILFHDLYLNSIEAFKRVTEILEAKGYVFVTVSQLMELNSGTTTGKRYWAAYYHD